MRTVVCALCLCGCFGAHSESFHGGVSDAEAAFRADGLKRAAFDLECPANEIELVELDHGAWNNFGAQVGVTGCGRRAVYTLNAYGQWHAEPHAEVTEVGRPRSL